MADLDYVSLAASLLGQPAPPRRSTEDAAPWLRFSGSPRIASLAETLLQGRNTLAERAARKVAREGKPAQDPAVPTQAARTRQIQSVTQQPPAAAQAAAPTSAGLAAAFPGVARWDPLIQENVQATGVEPVVWYAATEAESGGDPDVGSPAGALGVLQHMPDWGTEAQRRDPAWSYQTARPRFQQAWNALDEARQHGWNVDDPVERAVWTIARGQVYESEWPNNLAPAYQNPQAPSNQRVRAIAQRAYASQAQAASVPAQQAYPGTTPENAAVSLGTAGPFGGKRVNVDFDVDLPYGGAQWAGGPSHHRGVDITPVGGGIGEPITAMRRGRVLYADAEANGGNGLIVQELDRNGQPVTLADGSPVNIAYFHLARPAPFQVGQVVEQGQVIGQMGQSGTEGFPHLHLEIRRNAGRGDPRGTIISPWDYFPELRALRN